MENIIGVIILLGGHIICLAVCIAWLVARRPSIVYTLLFLLPIVSLIILVLRFALSGNRLPAMIPCLVGMAVFTVVSIRDARRDGAKPVVSSKKFIFGAIGLLWSTALAWFMSGINFMGAGC